MERLRQTLRGPGGWVVVAIITLFLIVMSLSLIRLNSQADDIKQQAADIKDIQKEGVTRGRTIQDLSLAVASALAPDGCLFRDSRAEVNKEIPGFKLPVKPGQCFGPGRTEANEILRRAVWLSNQEDGK